MDFSTTYAIDNTKEYPVVCNLDGALRILVQENFNSATPPTADLVQRSGHTGSGQINIAKGTPALFTSGPYRNGQQVGTIETATGSITVLQLETKQI